MQRFTIIEGWRAILAWWVVLSHMMGNSGFDKSQIKKESRNAEDLGHVIADWFQTLGYDIMFFARSGKIPVYVFVIISGFVISHLLVQKRERYDAYLVRRFFRLWPALFAVLLVFAGFQLAGAPLRDIESFWAHFMLEATMFHGIVPDQVMQDANSAISGPGWSISLEWQFYIVAPLIVGAFMMGGWRIAALFAGLIACLAFGVLNTKQPEVMAEGLTWSEPAFLPQVIGFFALGMVSYALMVKLQETEKPLRYGSSLVIVALLLAFNFKGPEGNWLPIMIWAAIFASIFTSGSLIHIALDNPVFRWLGTISYSTYITHMPVLIIVNQYLVRNIAERGTYEKVGYMILICTPLVLIVSALSYYFIEKPGIAIGRRIASKLTGKPREEFPQVQAPA